MQLRFKSGIRRTSKLAGFFTIVLIIIELSFISRAQTAVTGGLSGTVTDSTGAVVPNASVTIVNTATGTRTLRYALSNGTGNGTVLAEVVDNHFNHSCNSFPNPCFQTPGIFNGTGLTTDNNGNIIPAPPANAPNQAPQTNFGNVPPNAFYGPHYADVDLSLYKNVFQKGSMQLKVGAQAFNISNHTNFGTP